MNPESMLKGRENDWEIKFMEKELKKFREFQKWSDKYIIKNFGAGRNGLLNSMQKISK